ncbi:Pentatricopeptide repeat-containing protein, mitochondrial, partial [Glycine soja]
LSEWLESKKEFEFIERDYASRLDLIAKLRGLHKAEVYIETIPESCSREIMYRTLLAKCVSQNNVKKAEEVFSKMKDLDLPITVFTCNELLFLYKRNDKKKIADLLLLMENEKIKPSRHSYSILIDTKGQSKDIGGMDQIVDRMKAQGIEPDINTQAVLARHYISAGLQDNISAGLQDKAETLLKEMEGENLKQNRWLCRILLPLYANLGKVDEVGRIWKVCETNPRYDECLGAIEAWGKLNKIDEAEKVFEMMVKKWKLSSKTCSILLKVYANNEMLMKGKDLIKRIGDGGCRIGPLTWDAIVKLYVQTGEVEKADSVLQKAAQQSQMKPIFSTYLTILEQYAKRGDIHNSEKIFLRMKQADYTSKAKMYQVLMNAYINAKVPAYGIRDRLKADSIYPNRNLVNQLVQVDGFRKNPVCDLLD